jgi:hypothetical protein
MKPALSGRSGGSLNETGDGVAGLSPFTDPIPGAFQVQRKVFASFGWKVSSQFLDALTIARTTSIGDDDAKHRMVFCSDAFHPNPNHSFSFLAFGFVVTGLDDHS